MGGKWWLLALLVACCILAVFRWRTSVLDPLPFWIGVLQIAFLVWLAIITAGSFIV